MGMPIEGYSDAKLVRSSRRTRIYEATRADGLEVVAAIFEVDDDDVEALVEHEIETLRALALDGVVPAIGVTIARSTRSNAFRSELLPTFGFPTNATRAPSW